VGNFFHPKTTLGGSTGVLIDQEECFREKRKKRERDGEIKREKQSSKKEKEGGRPRGGRRGLRGGRFFLGQEKSPQKGLKGNEPSGIRKLEEEKKTKKEEKDKITGGVHPLFFRSKKIFLGERKRLG